KTGSGQIFAMRALRHLCHVLGLRPFGSVDHLEFDFLPLYQSLIAVTGDRAVMHENILLTRLFDKSVAFGIVKPFDLTDSLRHLVNSSYQLQKNLILFTEKQLKKHRQKGELNLLGARCETRTYGC